MPQARPCPLLCWCAQWLLGGPVTRYSYRGNPAGAPQAPYTHLRSSVGHKQQLGSTGQVAAGTSPLGIAATLVTPLERPLPGCTLGEVFKGC